MESTADDVIQIHNNCNYHDITKIGYNNDCSLDENEFETFQEESAKMYARNASDSSPAPMLFQDVFDNLNLNSSKISRKSVLSHVELDPLSKRLMLKVDKSNVRAMNGYDLGKDAYLYPEEALYLLELGKIEIFCNHVSLSVQRARSLLLFSQNSHATEKFAYSTTEEYLVYKHLTRMGYNLHRYEVCLDKDCSLSESLMMENHHPNMDSDALKMEDDDDDIFVEGIKSNDDNDVEIETDTANNDQRKCLKRKYSRTFSEDQISVESSEMMDSSDENYSPSASYFGRNVEKHANLEPGGYTVDEADSDVEIVDEVIHRHGGVEIQEIGHSVGCSIDDSAEQLGEPVPSTSRGSQTSEVLVDLVSSDDEDENLRSFEKRIWSKFIPNSKLVFGIPPSSLIPQKMTDNDAIYEFDLKDKSDVSDLELEFLVDEVSLNDDKYGRDATGSSDRHLPAFLGSRTWKEWRQSVFREARNAMNDSLLASSDYINGEAAAKKLFLWDERIESYQPLLNNIIFALYSTGPGFSRLKAMEGKPSYYIVVTRQDAQIPDFGRFGVCIDGVPILIAIVCDSGENDIVFLTADRSPLHSLF